MPSISQLRRADADARAAFLQRLADDLGERIVGRRLDEEQARRWAEALRFQASLLFPGRLDTWDRIYGARMERLIDQHLHARRAEG